MSHKSSYLLIIALSVALLLLVFWLGFRSSNEVRELPGIDPNVSAIRRDVPGFAELMTRYDAFSVPAFADNPDQRALQSVFRIATDGDLSNDELANVHLVHFRGENPRLIFIINNERGIYAEIANNSEGERLLADLQQFFSTSTILD